MKTLEEVVQGPPFLLSVSLISLLLVLGSASITTTIAQDGYIPILFYNTENLFDTIDAPDKSDEEYLPSSPLKHTTARYKEKLSHLAKVIDSSFVERSPELIGLCEVENRTVVEDLRDHISIEHHLDIVHFESPDERGIDNALLYDTVQFHFIEAGLAAIDLGDEERPTRGILWVILKEQLTGGTFVVMVNHWPSRYGGQEASNWKRMRASDRAVALIDSFEQVFEYPAIVLMGDLNDHPDNESVRQLTQCEGDSAGPCMVNMHERYLELDSGSHAYRGEWGVLDHILLNGHLLNYHSWQPGRRMGDFVRYEWMMYYNEKDEAYYPSRFYGRDTYYGGYSDHLPARVTIHLP